MVYNAKSVGVGIPVELTNLSEDIKMVDTHCIYETMGPQ